MTDPTDRAADRPVQVAGRKAGSEIEIHADPDRVWKAITDPEELVRWFPLEAREERGADGERRIWMSWGNEFGAWNAVEEWDPPRLLRTTWIMTKGGPSQATEYRIEGTDGGATHLRVVTSGFPPDAAWDDMVEGTRLGWIFELHQLKHYLESHDGEDRSAVYLRRRVGLSRDEAWARITAPGGPASVARGRVVDRTPPWQLALVAEDPPGGMLRITVDPSHDEPDARDVSVWVAGWGDGASRVEPVAEEWRSVLDAAFPDGRPLDAAQ